jgi:NAD(P)-dependent dehydrogenase (short-subunit alcohol dehydrogenase family)
VAPHMIETGHGSIVNISSGSARFGIRALSAYCTAKWGLEALTRAMALELAPKSESMRSRSAPFSPKACRAAWI